MLFDTSAWIEFFQGTEKGKIIETLLKKENNFTSIVTFAELTHWCMRTGQEHKIKDCLDGIKKGSGRRNNNTCRKNQLRKKKN
jgi:predicted nucleic acid-binding protein